MKYFSITEALSSAINHYFKNLKLFIPITLFSALAILTILWGSFSSFSCIDIPPFSYKIDILSKSYSSSDFGLNIQKTAYDLNVCEPQLMLYFLLGLYRAFMINFSLKIDNSQLNNNLKIADFLKLDFDIVKYFFARLRYYFTSLLGFLLLIIPGLIWTPRNFFAHYFIADKKLSISPSFAASATLTYGVKLKLLLFLLIEGFLYGLVMHTGGILRLFVHIMVYIPLIILAQTAIYKQLLASKETN